MHFLLLLLLYYHWRVRSVQLRQIQNITELMILFLDINARNIKFFHLCLHRFASGRSALVKALRLFALFRLFVLWVLFKVFLCPHFADVQIRYVVLSGKMIRVLRMLKSILFLIRALAFWKKHSPIKMWKKHSEKKIIFERI